MPLARICAGGSPNPSWARAVPTAIDFDGDGKLDLGAADPSNYSFNVAFGDGVGGFGPTVSTPVTVPRPSWFAVADFNVDGKADVGLAAGDPLDTMLSVGRTFGPEQHLRTNPDLGYGSGGAYGWGVSGDLNGDGIPDLAIPGGAVGGAQGVLIGVLQ